MVSFFLCDVSLFCTKKNGGKEDFLHNINNVYVSSLHQNILDLNTVILTGNVEVRVDSTTHVWADEVTFDRSKKTLSAKATISGAVMFETSDMLILADSIFLDLENQTGEAHNIRVRTGDTFISAKRGAKENKDVWRFYDIRYTACDERHPHWGFSAASARLRKGTLRAKSILFRIHDIPIAWVPGFIIPASYKTKSPSHSTSGFMLPSFAWDDTLGFGFNPEYYWGIASHVDNSAGINWREKKGYVIYDEFRYARSPEDYTIANVQFANEYNAFVERNNKVVQAHDHRYWIRGKHFEKIYLNNILLQNIVRIDFGTDKRIEYDFMGKTHDLEDQFLNSFMMRAPDSKGIVYLDWDHYKIDREKFTFGDQKREREEKFSAFTTPHVEWWSSFFKEGTLFDHSHHAFVDLAFSRRRITEKIYSDFNIIGRSESIPLEKTESVRFYYQGAFFKNVHIGGHQFRFKVEPNVQIRNKVKNRSDVGKAQDVIEGAALFEGAYRVVGQYGIEWALPQRTQRDNHGLFTHFWQPIVRWNYVPKFEQDHWFFVDRWDRIFPTNELSAQFRSDWYFDDIYVGFGMSQGYEFYKHEDIFPLRRSGHREQLLPFKFDMHLNSELVFFESEYQIDLKRGQLLQAEFTGGVRKDPFYVTMSIFYQHPDLQRERELLSDIPSFALVTLGLPLLYNLRVGYEGHFYSPSNSLVAAIKDPHALYHRVRFEYDGHCWGASIGFEEKRYRQQGRTKSEQAYFFALKLESIGSVSKQFKKEPVVLKAPLDYR